MGNIKEKIRSLASEKMSTAKAFYRSSPEFRVDQSRSDDGVVVTDVLMDVYQDPDGKKFHFLPYQSIRERNGQVLELSSGLGASNHYADDDSGIRAGVNITDNGQAYWHWLDMSEDEGTIRLQELSRVHNGTDVRISYDLDELKQEFRLERVSAYGPDLPKEDVAKFLPNGRRIPLGDVLDVVIDFHRSVGFYHEKVEPVHHLKDFPKLGNYTPGQKHFEGYISPHDYKRRDDYTGYAHQLRENGSGWLVFVGFKDGRKEQGRAFRIEADRETIKTIEDSAGLKLRANLKVDGIPTEVTVRENRVKVVGIDDTNRHLSIGGTNVYDGQEFGRIPITLQELDETREDYLQDLITAAIEIQYQQWRNNKNVG